MKMGSVIVENRKKVRTMAEYIEREALMRRIKEIHCAECDSYHGVRCRACWVDDTLDYIDSESAADVVKVVHGKWDDNGIAGSMLVKCSVCGFDCGANSFSYCPNCGARMRKAKMDGGNEGE